MNQNIIVLDFGSQTTQLLAERARDASVRSLILPCTASVEEIQQYHPIGIILSGSPASVVDHQSPTCDKRVFSLNIPILGVCYGAQLIANEFGGVVGPAPVAEFGPAELRVESPSPLLDGIGSTSKVWMSHNDQVTTLPPGFVHHADTVDCRNAVFSHPGKQLYGVQFHPEVKHSECGGKLLENFLLGICGALGDWTMDSFIDTAVADLKRRVGDHGVLLALSGGVDSTVAALLLARAVGERLTCVFVDNGMLRDGEFDRVRLRYGKNYGFNLRAVPAQDRFFAALEGLADPEAKRKAIGKVFIEVFEDEAKTIADATFLAQGTLYPDVVESLPAHGGPGVTIKSHHNVGGLPERLGFKLLEPLRELCKDEVRRLGLLLGMPEEDVWRQPFPGPGLAVRVLGEVTREKITLVRQADKIIQEELRACDTPGDIWQTFAVLLPPMSVGVMGDARTHGHVIAIRAVESKDGLTADWSPLPYPLLRRMSRRITNEVKGVNRVVFDITSKPPATIEWE